jgi:hypothetical protein
MVTDTEPEENIGEDVEVAVEVEINLENGGAVGTEATIEAEKIVVHPVPEAPRQ